jgi:flavodoxin
MIRVLIVYDTRYGSTQTVAEWIAQGAAIKGPQYPNIGYFQRLA